MEAHLKILQEINSNAQPLAKPTRLTRQASKITPVDHKAAADKIKGIMDNTESTGIDSKHVNMIKSLPGTEGKKPSFVKHMKKQRVLLST